MDNKLNLIVMLTWHDRTVMNAEEIFQQCRESKAVYWGMKESPLPLERMKQLYDEMRACGKKTVLEVVAYTEEECLAGAKMAAACGCDILLGTCFFPSVLAYCRQHSLKYMPYVGQVSGRPSVLEGSIDDMIREAEDYLSKGVYGINLLAYRYAEDADALISRFSRAISAPVCIAGSISSLERLKKLKSAEPWSFTVGSAFFEHKFGEKICDQIDLVCDCMK